MMFCEKKHIGLDEAFKWRVKDLAGSSKLIWFLWPCQPHMCLPRTKQRFEFALKFQNEGHHYYVIIMGGFM